VPSLNKFLVVVQSVFILGKKPQSPAPALILETTAPSDSDRPFPASPENKVMHNGKKQLPSEY
jgi:hypothetical protein